MMVTFWGLYVNVCGERNRSPTIQGLVAPFAIGITVTLEYLFG